MTLRFSETGLAALFFLAAFLPARAGEPAEPVLYIYTWAEYFDPGVVETFERRRNCRVEFTYYDSNETMLTSLADGGGGYDVITPPPYIVETLRRIGLLMPLSHDKIPNLANLSPRADLFTHDRTFEYSAPYTGTITGIGYDVRRVPPEDCRGWAIFSHSRYAGNMAMLNDMRETFGAALKHLGKSANTTDAGDIRLAGELLREWKDNLAVFDVDRAKAGLIDGAYLAIQGYSGDIAEAMARNRDIGFYVPAEGSTLNADLFVIAADSQSPDLAHAFINHMLDADMARANMESVRYFMPNAPALRALDPALSENPAFNVSEDTLARCELIVNVGAAQELYDIEWENVLLGGNE